MEANIIYRITKGDERAFDRMMDAWSARLYRYALNITQSSEVAEEVVSDVFLEVWKMRSSLLEISSLDSWLHTVTYRKAVTALRHLASRPEGVPLDEVTQYIMDPIPSPDEDIISREEGERLNEAIRQLPDKCRHVFYLAKIDCIPYKEIASMLNITVATVNYHVGYAMDSLRRALRTSS